jgi:hypothetical protein
MKICSYIIKIDWDYGTCGALIIEKKQLLEG